MPIMSGNERKGPDDLGQLLKEFSELRKEIELQPIPEKIKALAKRLQDALTDSAAH